MKRKTANFKRIEHLTTEYSARVKFNEVDSLGIVWHGNYIDYFEEGREAFGRAHGISYLDMKNNGYSTPIVDIACSYKFPLRYGDTYTIKTYMLNTPAAKVMLEFEIFNEDNVLICEGHSVQVFVDFDGNLALYAPEFYEEWKKKVNFK